MLFATHGIVWLIVSLFLGADAADYVVEFQRTENIPGKTKSVVDFAKWRVTRFKKDYFLNGEFTFKEDMDNTFSKTFSSAYSALGNNQFIAQPFKIPDTPMCEFYNTPYKKYVMPTFEGHSDFPTIPPEGLCPIPKGTYHAKNIELNSESLPDHLPNGLWRIEERYFQNKELVGGIDIFVKITPLIN